MVGTYEALLWLCEWNLGEQRGKRAKGEQTGSLNRVFFTDLRPFSRIWGLFRDLGPFWGFGAFFGDSWPLSGIRGLFVDSRPFHGFAAFLRIRCLFADSRIHGQGSEGSERATWRNFRYLIFINRKLKDYSLRESSHCRPPQMLCNFHLNVVSNTNFSRFCM